MRKIIIIIFITALSISNFPQVVVHASEDESKQYIDNGNKITISNEENQSLSSIETVYLDNGVNKYIINEYGDEYTLIIDINEDNVYVGDFEMSMDAYRGLIRKQAEFINDLHQNKSLMYYAKDFRINKEAINDYEQKHILYKHNMENHIHDEIGIRCTTCPLHTIAVPTSNYKSKQYYVNSYVTSEVIKNTTNSITLIASILTFGTVSIARNIVVNLLAKVGATMVNAQISYDAYQSFHNVCPKAVKEKRVGSIRDKKTNKIVNNTAYNYFYSSKP